MVCTSFTTSFMSKSEGQKKCKFVNRKVKVFQSGGVLNLFLFFNVVLKYLLAFINTGLLLQFAKLSTSYPHLPHPAGVGPGREVLDDHPSRYQPRLTVLHFSNLRGTAVFSAIEVDILLFPEQLKNNKHEVNIQGGGDGPSFFPPAIPTHTVDILFNTIYITLQECQDFKKP